MNYYFKIIYRLLRSLLNYWTINKKEHLFGIMFCNGCRIGNQMFFIAAGETFRKRYGWNVVYYTPVKKDYIAIDKWIYRKIKPFTFYHDFPNRISEDMLLSKDSIDYISRLLLSNDTLCAGNYEDVSLIDKDVALELFQMPDTYKKQISSLYGDLSQYVSIHVRRGDFVNLGLALSKEYYIKAMSYFDPNQKFIIISDDLDWCKSAFGSSENLCYADKHSHFSDRMYYDLFLPSLCEVGNIISCSTFNWWGAFLNHNSNSKNIMPYPWWGYIYNKNLYLNNTIKLDIRSLEFISNKN